MRTALAIGAIVASAVVTAASPSSAADTSDTGNKAPSVALQSVIGGSVRTYNLQTSAAKAPVVLYFFPEAFSAG